MTIDSSDDRKTLAISVVSQTYEQLERRAAAVGQAVDQYVFDLVVRDAYARRRVERLWHARPAWSSALALTLLAVGYFTHADWLLPVAAVLIVIALASTTSTSKRRRRYLQRGIRAETRRAEPPGTGG